MATVSSMILPSSFILKRIVAPLTPVLGVSDQCFNQSINYFLRLLHLDAWPLCGWQQQYHSRCARLVRDSQGQHHGHGQLPRMSQHGGQAYRQWFVQMGGVWDGSHNPAPRSGWGRHRAKKDDAGPVSRTISEFEHTSAGEDSVPPTNHRQCISLMTWGSYQYSSKLVHNIIFLIVVGLQAFFDSFRSFYITEMRWMWAGPMCSGWVFPGRRCHKLQELVQRHRSGCQSNHLRDGRVPAGSENHGWRSNRCHVRW